MDVYAPLVACGGVPDTVEVGYAYAIYVIKAPL